MGAMSPLGHRATCPQAPQHSPRSTAKPSWHSAAMLGRQRASKTAWGPPGASMGITWGTTSTARVSPLSPHSPWGHTMRGCGGVPSEGLSSRASKAWVSVPGKGSHSVATTLGTQHPAHPPLPRVPGTQAAPRCSRGPQGSPCAAGSCPLQPGWTVRVFQVTPGTAGVSSTGTQSRGNSWPAGGSMATTWAQAMDGTGVVP